jgi:hypothetical protein
VSRRRTSRKITRDAAAPVRTPRRRVAVGPPRPHYLLNQENDRMMMIIMALTAEVSALRERLDTHEALGEKRRFATSKAVESYKLPAVRRDAREQSRQAMLSRVLRVLTEDLEAAHQDPEDSARAILRQETAEQFNPSGMSKE